MNDRNNPNEAWEPQSSLWVDLFLLLIALVIAGAVVYSMLHQ